MSRSDEDLLVGGLRKLVAREVAQQLRDLVPQLLVRREMVSQYAGERPEGTSANVYLRAWRQLARQGESTLVKRGRARLMPRATWDAYVARLASERKARSVVNTTAVTTEDDLLADFGVRRHG